VSGVEILDQKLFLAAPSPKLKMQIPKRKINGKVNNLAYYI
jgi:hypothetical protein